MTIRFKAYCAAIGFSLAVWLTVAAIVTR